MSDISTRPYLIRAIYEWCVDNGFTPYLAVRVNAQTRVPMGFVKDGQIVLNLSDTAVRHLQMQNDFITCSGRFGGSPFNLVVPINAVEGIFARENGEGLMFPVLDDEPSIDSVPEIPTEQEKTVVNKPRFTVVK